MSVNIRSARAEFDKAGWDLVKEDLQSLGRAVNTATVTVSGQASVLAPATGTAKVYASSRVTTTGSTGANYHIVTVNRSDTVGPDGLGVDTRATEVAGYTVLYFGSFPVAFGDRLDVIVNTTGAPTAMTASDWTIMAIVEPLS